MKGGFVPPKIGDILKEKYVVTKSMGAGSFGAIFEVQSLENGKIYAVKLENPKTPSPQLNYEYKLYQLLDAPVAIPRVYEYWSQEDYRAMIMDRLGRSLGYYFRECGKILSMKTTLMCAIQMLCRLEYLHQRSFIHRDIKPDNFVFGVGTNSNLLYLIDLGLAKKYRDLHTFIHINYAEDKGLAGTARYVSVNVHLGVEQSCRDDLESVGYVLISLVKGRLPWQGMEGLSKNEKYEMLAQAKMDTPPEVLCQGLPNEFLTYMQKVRSFKFDEKPCYSFLRGLFINLMVKMNFAFDYQYDWVINKRKRLDESLRGVTDKNSVIIPTNSDELVGAKKTNVTRQNNFLQPLPFFSAVDEAARFVGFSHLTAEKNEEKVEKKLIFPKKQEMFLLEPGEVEVENNDVLSDFEIGE
ncbi:CK1 family protein kinase [Histomonas meleagridis]|uniref:CK1 family protein kinase n=1 Tax=Histomonas meleagridis TaxID=135588 RepID=UPI00355A00FA|nr:CK1 family protein kinase [Histomonas meleagridis]KAH0796898.1 CK1 family protein kinase [Histomonas meleagridis]